MAGAVAASTTKDGNWWSGGVQTHQKAYDPSYLQGLLDHFKKGGADTKWAHNILDPKGDYDNPFLGQNAADDMLLQHQQDAMLDPASSQARLAEGRGQLNFNHGNMLENYVTNNKQAAANLINSNRHGNRQEQFGIGQALIQDQLGSQETSQYQGLGSQILGAAMGAGMTAATGGFAPMAKTASGGAMNAARAGGVGSWLVPH